MTNKEFQKILQERLKKTKDTLTAKADEYARGDRLSNFERIAHLARITREEALAVLVSKHIIAFYDFVNDLKQGNVQSPERWDEKIGDIIAYMCLFDAMIQQRATYKESQTVILEKGALG